MWQLVQALSSLVSRDGNTILVPGYYDDIRPPNDEESRLINAGIEQAATKQRLLEVLGVSQWIDGMTGVDALVEYPVTTTMNIDGIWGGYTGEGTKTILPHRATAKVDSRLPPDIDPDEAIAKIRAHLDNNGFADIEIRQLGGYPAAQTSVEEPAVQAAISVFRKYADTFACSHAWRAARRFISSPSDWACRSCRPAWAMAPAHTHRTRSC